MQNSAGTIVQFELNLPLFKHNV